MTSVQHVPSLGDLALSLELEILLDGSHLVAVAFLLDDVGGVVSVLGQQVVIGVGQLVGFDLNGFDGPTGGSWVDDRNRGGCSRLERVVDGAVTAGGSGGLSRIVNANGSHLFVKRVKTGAIFDNQATSMQPGDEVRAPL